MLPAMADTAAPAPVTLVLGPAELLVDRAVAAIVAAARAADPTADVRRLMPVELEPARLAELTSPSLFGETAVLVVQRAHELAAEAAAALAAYIRNPAEHVVLVVCHGGQANRAKAVLEACRAVKAPQVACQTPKPFALPGFVQAEVRAAGGQISEDAARLLVDSVGPDLRDLAAACSQLLADTPGTAEAPERRKITASVVARYYAGRAEVKSFEVADLAVEGRTTEALQQLRYALACGVAPVLVTSALAQGLRTIGRLGAAPRGAQPADLARDLGIPPWKVDAVRRQLRGWSGDGLAVAIRAVAEADGMVKGLGGGHDPAYALERAVVAIGRARSGE
jgi:DNA polymerase-3 subunit delta